MKILSILLGTPKTIHFMGREITTAIYKEKVAGPVFMRQFNLEGDGQADLSVHGGRDKAIYAYSFDAYKAWEKIRPNDSFEAGSMGENLSVDHLPEDKLYVGDTFEVGEAVVQVSEPRFPCSKLAMKFNDPGILKQFMKLKRPGVYFRVLKEGFIDVDQEFHLIGQESEKISIEELFLKS